MKNSCFKLIATLLPLTFLLTINMFAQRPSVYFEPSALEANVAPNNTVVVHSVLHNNTQDNVEFYFPGYTSRDLGGPDSYGYSWIDSDEPNGPDWAWTDISEAGILVEGLGDDLMAGPYEFDIDFPFYGQIKNHFWISSNGCISFDEQVIPYANDSIPTNSNYIDFIAWFWDDLTIDPALTSVYFKNFEEKTIVQFNRMVHFPGTESFITAQIVFIDNGSILIRYKQVSENFETNSATIGIQAWNPELGLQVAYNEEYVHSEMVLRFDLERNFITTVSPSSLVLEPGTQETIWITYSAEGYESGNYEQDLKCITSHPEYPYLILHNVMHVTNPEGYYFLVGRVFAGENPIESGFAYGYKMMEENVVDIYAEMVGELGWYEFSGLAAANYIVKAEPSPTSMYYGDYLPTYFGDVIHWEDASVIELDHNSDDGHIHLVAIVSAPQGPGNISGTIESNGRASGIPIILKSAEAAIMTYSSTNGTYQFSSLAYGTYEIFAEIPGKSITPQIITLDETNPSVEGVDMMIMESEIIFLGIAESELFENAPFIYPNPVTDMASIMIDLKKPSLVNVILFDQTGRIIKKESHNINGHAALPLDLSNLSRGIYMMKIEAGAEEIVLRLIKN